MNSLFRQFDGPLTSELVRRPGGFGLGQVPARLEPDATTTLICGFCSTGCGLQAHLRDGVAVNLTPSASHPVNLGMACPKGWEALTPLEAPDRATLPLVRDGAGRLQPVSWGDAAGRFVSGFKGLLERHGPDSVAVLGTGQICTEELALLGSFFKFGMGGLHADSNTRQCMATAHVAYKQALGFDAPPYTYADFEAGDVLVLIGSNLAIAHPILWQRVLRNPNHPSLIVIDPRRTETAANATQHLALQPKSDLVLLYGLAHLLIENGWIRPDYIEAHTTGFEDFRDFVRVFTPDRVAAETGLAIGELFRTAQTIGCGRAVSFWWTMGVNQGHESTRTAQAIINLALITGNVGRPGTGANSITGQCNAMGSRLFANTSSLLGGRDFKNPQHRREVAGILGFPETLVPDQDSWAYDQILDAIDAGVVRGLWIIATNGAHSWIGQDRFRRTLERLDFLVVQDMYTTTETARLAHLLLPAAGWGEKEGTFINSERRIGVVRKVRRAPGQALADFLIFQLLAEAWGCRNMFRDWQTPQDAFQRLKDLSRGRPCDFTGIPDFDALERLGGVQWPWPEAFAAVPPQPERRLFADGQFFTADGRARILFETPKPPPETPTAAFPMILLTGRGSSAQWHTGSRTSKSAILRQLYPDELRLEIHPDDATRLGISPLARVRITSPRASIEAVAFPTHAVQSGQVFLPMHDPAVNRLTRPAFDPYSRQPSYKFCAVRVEPLDGPLPRPDSPGTDAAPLPSASMNKSTDGVPTFNPQDRDQELQQGSGNPRPEARQQHRRSA